MMIGVVHDCDCWWSLCFKINVKKDELTTRMMVNIISTTRMMVNIIMTNKMMMVTSWLTLTDTCAVSGTS